MPLGNEYLFASGSHKGGAVSSVRVRLRTFQIPPIRDGAVIGRLAPIGREIMAQTLQLISPERFISIDLSDDVVAAIIVREAILRKVGWETVKKIVLNDLKPLMAKSEILALQLEVEIALGENF